MANNDLDQPTEEQVITAKIELNESALGESEPWESWETNLVIWSLILGLGGLLILGTLINLFLLH